MSLEYMAKIHALLGEKQTIYCKDKEIIKDLLITEIHTAQHVPPYDHFVMSFEAVCQHADFTDYISHNPQGLYIPMYTIKTGDMEILIYIDSYSINTMDISMFDDSFPRHIQSGATVCGHFDSRNFDGRDMERMSEEEMMASEEPINNRFEILDL